MKEQIKGTLKKDPDLKQHGKERYTGELKKKERDAVSTTSLYKMLFMLMGFIRNGVQIRSSLKMKRKQTKSQRPRALLRKERRTAMRSVKIPSSQIECMRLVQV